MFNRLLPQTIDFFIFFEAHILVVLKASSALLEMIINPANPLRYYAEKIQQSEKEADKITFECLEALHNSFITPFDRNDIHRLITHMDDVIDMIEDIAARIVIYQLNPVDYNIKTLAEYLHTCVEKIMLIVHVFREGPLPEEAKVHFKEIHLIENKADVFLRESMATLFKQEKDPIQIIKWKEIYENLEDSVDSCEKVANIIDGILIENH